jgi:class 3 adenylate cyclase
MPTEARPGFDTSITPVILSFRGREVEEEYLCWYFEKSLQYVRWGLLGACALFVFFGFLDWGLNEANPAIVHRLWLVRYGIICPTIGLLYAFTYSRHFQKYMQVSLALGSVLSGVGILLLSSLALSQARHFYYAGICLTLVYTSTVLRVRFVHVIVVAILLTVAYIVTAVKLGTPFHVFLNNVCFLLSFDVVGVASGYMYEIYLRRIFLQMRKVEEQDRELRLQEEVAEGLLLNTLPAEVANELKCKGRVEPRYYDDVTVLFTDFKAFTFNTEGLSAVDLVARLNDYFSAFDVVTEKYGLEKLKTIGDSYMCVAGLPTHSESHAIDCVLAAFEILDEVAKRQLTRESNWSIRIGLHTGPVVSGVVGTRKFAFDIWGASVNLASRMESTGMEGRVNISASTYEKVKDFFCCEYRGKISTKEHREYDMYFVNGVHDKLLLGGNGPVPEAFLHRYQTYFQRPLEYFPDGLRFGEISPSSDGIGIGLS